MEEQCALRLGLMNEFDEILYKEEISWRHKCEFKLLS